MKTIHYTQRPFGTQGGIWVTRGLLIVAFATALVLAVLFFTGRRSALLRMQADERGALYQQTLASYRELCEKHPAAVTQPICKEQAALLSQFPECEPACQATIAEDLPGATK